MTVHKAERLLNLIVCLLETERPISVQQIQDTVPGYSGQGWEAFKRMFERDKDALREVGIPLDRTPVTVRGETEEGYRIPKERYYLPDLTLAPEEVAALWLAAGLVRMQDPGTARAALLKLSDGMAGALPGELDGEPLPWLRADLGLAVPGLPRAFEAVADRRTVTFSYRGGSSQQQRTLDPYGLVHRKGAWYLVGRDHARDELRSFRLDRVVGELRYQTGGGAPQASGAEFETPAGFRPQEALEVPPFIGKPSGGPPDAGADVTFDASTAWWVERSHPWLRLAWAPDGSATATVAVTDEEGFVSWVLSLGEGVEVTGPAAVRKALLTRLEEACGG